MGEATAANINRQIEKIKVSMSELDLRISAHENLASMKKPPANKEIAALSDSPGEVACAAKQTSSPSVTGRANYYQR
jgi:hypothetical protein